MVDEASPPRKRGRPRKSPEEVSRRPNFSLRVRQEIYDDLVENARSNGRSISEEVEHRLESAKVTITEAVEAARNDAYHELEQEFGGKLTISFMGIFAEAFNTELRKATSEDDDNAALFRDEARRKEFAQALACHIPGTVKAIAAMAAFGDLLSDLNGQLEAMKSDDPAGYEALRSEIIKMIAARRSNKSSK